MNHNFWLKVKDTIFCITSHNESNFRKVIYQHLDIITVYAEKKNRKITLIQYSIFKYLKTFSN